MVHVLIRALKLPFLSSLVASLSFQCSNREPWVQTFLFLSHLTSRLLRNYVCSTSKCTQNSPFFMNLTVTSLFNPPWCLTWIVAVVSPIPPFSSGYTQHSSQDDPFAVKSELTTLCLPLPDTPHLPEKEAKFYPFLKALHDQAPVVLLWPHSPHSLPHCSHHPGHPDAPRTHLRQGQEQSPIRHRKAFPHFRSSLKCLLFKKVAFSDHPILNYD